MKWGTKNIQISVISRNVTVHIYTNVNGCANMRGNGIFCQGSVLGAATGNMAAVGKYVAIA